MPAEDLFVVNDLAPLGLNLRTSPEVTPHNILAVIPRAHEVSKLEESQVAQWWRVRTSLNASPLEGFVNSRFLRPALEPAEAFREITAVHLPTNGISVTRQGASRAHPLTEVPPVKRRATDPRQTRVDALASLLEWFGVESGKRYLRTGGSTFCNIYAYDYVFMSDAYLPRVWWTAQALLKLREGQSVPVKYGETVEELSANALNDWFKNWGEQFHWKRVFSLTEMQKEANDGKVCITVARAKQHTHNGHGHIVAVVPETSTFRALREGGEVTKTVQSQAGNHNHDYVVQRWWDDGSYADFGHWIHE
jgi:hypothetical protein